MSKTNTTKREIFAIIERIQKRKRGTIVNHLANGQDYWNIKEKQLYKDYGEHINSFDAFLREIGEDRGTAYNDMRIYLRFGEYVAKLINEGKVQDLNYFRLVRLLPVAKENPNEWVDKANHLKDPQFNNELIEAKTGKSPDLCEHEHQDIITRCHTCQKSLSITKNYEE